MTVRSKLVFQMFVCTAFLLALAPMSQSALYTGTGPGSSTIGTGGDYATMSAIVTDVSGTTLTGGDWTFEFINDVTDTSEVYLNLDTNGNTITFKPASGLDVTLVFAGAANAPGGAAVSIDSTDNIVIDGDNGSGGRHLTIWGHTSPYVWEVVGNSDGCQLKNLYLPRTANPGGKINISGSVAGGAPSNVLIENASITTRGNEYHNIYGEDGGAPDVLFRDCEIDASNIKTRLSSVRAADVTFENCKFDFESNNGNSIQGFWWYNAYNSSMTFDSCNIYWYSRGDGDNGVGHFVTAFTDSTVTTFRNCMIVLEGGATNGSKTGMNVWGAEDLGGDPNNGDGTANFYNNSLYMFNSSGDFMNEEAGQNMGFTWGNDTCTGTVNAANNVIYNGVAPSGSQSQAYVAPFKVASTMTLDIDNNMYYLEPSIAEGPAIGKDENGAYTDLLSWQTALGLDANSVETVNPDAYWVDGMGGDMHFDLQPFAGDVNWYATPLGSVTVDFDGTTRHATYPTKGAVEADNLPPRPVSNVSNWNLMR